MLALQVELEGRLSAGADKDSLWIWNTASVLWMRRNLVNQMRSEYPHGKIKLTGFELHIERTMKQYETPSSSRWTARKSLHRIRRPGKELDFGVSCNDVGLRKRTQRPTDSVRQRPGKPIEASID